MGTASRDHLLKLFDIRNLKEELQTFRGHKKEASCVQWHPVHEGMFASGGSDGCVMYWNVGADKETGVIETAHESIVWCLSWHPSGNIGDSVEIKVKESVKDNVAIPGMAPEDRVESSTAIPGLDFHSPVDIQAEKKKQPFSK